MISPDTVRETVQTYYGQTLQSNHDLKTSACCPTDALPGWLRPYVQNVHPDVQAKFYGCGSPIPLVLTGKTVVDLGCGTGRDCYVLSQLVGELGQVIGVDMTAEQIAVAQRYLDYHTALFHYPQANVRFHQGQIENLTAAGLADHSVDVVVSNCVINLSANKEQVFSEIFRVLKPGGELYFSDIFAGRRIPSSLQQDPVLLGECLAGALYIEDFRRLLRSIGCLDYRVVSKTPVVLEDEALQQKAGMIDFYSMTVRAFKVDLEDICENYGHVAFYQGTIPQSPHAFVLDDHHVFPTGIPVPVCGNTAQMLTHSRYGEHFRVIGDFSTHYGVFDCQPSTPIAGTTSGCC